MTEIEEKNLAEWTPEDERLMKGPGCISKC